MMIDPSFETMTDDQLYEYVTKLTTKLSMASRLSGGSGAFELLQRLLLMARQVQTDRAMAKSFNQMMASRAKEIVTDPSLMPKVEISTKKNASQPHFKRVQIQRSAKPSNEIDLSPSPPEQDKK